MDWTAQNMQKHSFFKKMVANRYASHVLSTFNCMPQHYIRTMYCYRTFQFKRFTNYKYILFITTLPYRITPKHVITLTVKCPNMENETICKFRSNITDMYFEHYEYMFQDKVNQNKTFLFGSIYSNRHRNLTLLSETA
jgi:hypothetical protein